MAKQVVLLVYVAGISCACEFMVPADMPAGAVVVLMQKLLLDEYGVDPMPLEGQLMLICADTGEALNDAMSLQQSGVDGSTRLILA